SDLLVGADPQANGAGSRGETGCPITRLPAIRIDHREKVRQDRFRLPRRLSLFGVPAQKGLPVPRHCRLDETVLVPAILAPVLGVAERREPLDAAVLARAVPQLGFDVAVMRLDHTLLGCQERVEDAVRHVGVELRSELELAERGGVVADQVDRPEQVHAELVGRRWWLAVSAPRIEDELGPAL